MSGRKETSLAPIRRDPFTALREMTSELERMFDEPFWGTFRWPSRVFAGPRAAGWSPEIDVFEKDNRLFVKVDLPGMKKDDVKVEFADGQLVVSGERKSEAEEKKESFYRCEREYGSFYRSVPVPEGVTFEDIQATFSDGVLEVSVPLPARAETKVRKIEIREPSKTAKAA